MIEYNGTPFQYNPAVTNVNIDNQLSSILSQFNDDYIMDVVKDSINSRFRLYDLPKPNIVSAFETTFKQLTDGFESNVVEISNTRNRVYTNIIHIICDYYDLDFNLTDDTDLYSAAYWLYDFLVANFTENLKNFYVFYFIRERESIESALQLIQTRSNDPIFAYSKKLFKDPKLAAIHSNIEYVIEQMSSFNVDLWTILNCVYQQQLNVPSYIMSLISDTGNFFNNYYEAAIIQSNEAADLLTYIKLALQQIGGQIE